VIPGGYRLWNAEHLALGGAVHETLYEAFRNLNDETDEDIAAALAEADDESEEGSLPGLLATYEPTTKRLLVSGFWPRDPGDCPRAPHRGPEGPCEDVAQCGLCGLPSFDLRPEGETYGFHARDCSLPLRHEGACVGGGTGHPPVTVRGWWPGMDDDLRVERDYYATSGKGGSQ